MSQLIVPASGQVGSLGDNILVTPPVGRTIRVYYFAWNPVSGPVEAAMRLGLNGPLFLRNSVLANAVIAKEFGSARFLDGDIDEKLYLVILSGASAVDWNCLYMFS